MKKTLKPNRICISICLALFCAGIYAQDGALSFYAVSMPDAGEAGTETVQTLDAYYNTFNDVFHFSKSGPGFLFPVTLFNSNETYAAYVTEKTGGIAPAADAVFLRYNNVQRSEVAALADSITRPVFIRQLFLQYLSCYLPDYPQWLFGGYTLIFENRGYAQNPWLETAKKLTADPAKKLTLSQMFAAQKNDYTNDRLFPQAMLLVQFLEQNASNTYRRLLFEGLAALKAGKSSPITSQEAFGGYAEYWLGSEQADDAFSIYASSLKTVSELLTEGISAYTMDDLKKASEYFAKVTALDAANSTAWYYAGLTAYKQKNYEDAEFKYKKAVDTGANAALVNWAMAVNAYAGEKYTQAAAYATQAKTLDKAAYTQKADELIKSIPQGKK